MTGATLGLVLPHAGAGGLVPPASVWAMAEAADRPGSGLTNLWTSDHLLWWDAMYESIALLGALAARTSRVGLGTAVLLVALREPVATAKALATVDRLSGGRVTVGVGVGGEYAPEWEAVGSDPRTRGRRTDAAIRRMRDVWNGGLDPAPAGAMPVWVGGRSDAALRRAGRLGDGWMGLFTTPERYAGQVAAARAAAEAAGRDPAALVASLYVWTAVGETAAEARAAAADALPRFYRLPFDRMERYVVAGTAASCAEQLAAFATAGARHLAVAPATSAPGPETVDRLTAVADLLRGG